MKKLTFKQLEKKTGGRIDPSCRGIVEYLFENGQSDQAWAIIDSDVYYVC